MTEHAKQILDSVMEEITAEKAVAFIRERLFSDGIDIPCKRWSCLNQFVAFLNGTGDARGYNQWKEAGRAVKKGAKAIYILVPMIYKIKDKEKEGQEEEVLKGFKAMPVFRAEDTEGKELDYIAKLREFDPDSLPLIDVARSLGISVSAGLTGDAGGWFRPADKSITMGSNSALTFLHELSHAVDHALPDKSLDHAFNEVVAELSAAFLCNLYGINYNHDSVTAYIRSWAGEDRAAFFCVAALERVEAIYHYIQDAKQQCLVKKTA
jgi:antirestriction protein ArdC